MRLASTLAIALCLAGCAPEGIDSGAPAGEARAELGAGDWQSWAEAEAARLERARPELVAAVRDLEPTLTRAGTLRFTDPLINDADAAALLLRRFGREVEPARRAAVAEALPRTGGRFAVALADLYAAEADAGVREVLVAIAWRAPAAEALAVIDAGLADESPRVRTTAAQTAARHPEGARLADALVARLSDDAAPVRAAAARALGVRKVAAAEAEAGLRRLVDDGDAEVRLAALRALDRSGSLARDPAPAARLAADPDPRVRRLAARLAETAR